MVTICRRVIRRVVDIVDQAYRSGDIKTVAFWGEIPLSLLDKTSRGLPGIHLISRGLSQVQRRRVSQLMSWDAVG